MSTETRFPATVAYEAARLLIAEVRPLAEQLVLVGSLRRLMHRNRDEGREAKAFLPEDTVSDIEIVAEARYVEVPHPKYPLIEKVLKNQIWQRLDELVNDKHSSYQMWTLHRAWGDKLRKVAVPLPDGGHIKCEFHCVVPGSFGYKVALATGDAGWNHLMVTSRRQGGLRPEYVRLEDLLVYRRDVLTPVLTEQAFFWAMEMPWTPPHKRTREAAERLHRELEVMA
jgi:hypothetical protein